MALGSWERRKRWVKRETGRERFLITWQVRAGKATLSPLKIFRSAWHLRAAAKLRATLPFPCTLGIHLGTGDGEREREWEGGREATRPQWHKWISFTKVNCSTLINALPWMSANVTREAICHRFNSFPRLMEGVTESKKVCGERRKMMSHMERETDKVRGPTNARMYTATHRTAEGLGQREREQMRTRQGYCHFHMIKQSAIWDVSNKVVQRDRSGYLEHNPCPASPLSNLSPYLFMCLCTCTHTTHPTPPPTHECIYSMFLTACLPGSAAQPHTHTLVRSSKSWHH